MLILDLLHYRTVDFYYYYFIYNKKFNVYVILTYELRKSSVLFIKTIRILNFAARFHK